MTHHHLALERTYSLKRNAYYDEDRCTAEADTAERGNAQRENDGEYRDNSEEYRTYQCDLVERIVDKIRSGFTRSVTRDSTVVLLIRF